MGTKGDTPLMQQYWELKQQAGDALLLFRMGDFYELFGEDAKEAATILSIALTSRDRNKPNPLPMAGVPYHALEGYLQKLLRAGRKVAIGEQLEEAGPGVKLVKRGITRIFTPAVHFNEKVHASTYLAILLPDKDNWIASLFEPNTGEVLVSEPIPLAPLKTELQAYPIRHVLVGGKHPHDFAPDKVLREELPTNYLALPQARELLQRQYGVGDLAALFSHDSALWGVACLVNYVLKSQQQESLPHIRVPRKLREQDHLILGPHTATHLDLVSRGEASQPNLFDAINGSRSSLGARRLKRWLLAPSNSLPAILLRQAAVQELAAHPRRRDALAAVFSELYDLERILGRINTRLASPRDTLALGQSIALIPKLREILKDCQTPLLKDADRQLQEMSKLLLALGRNIVARQREPAPLLTREGGIFHKGSNSELDRLIDLAENGAKYLLEMEKTERSNTGINNLKIRYNRVFGYFIEVTKTQLKNVPAHYQRKQSMANAERFFTPELKKFEDEFISSESKRKSLEAKLFDEEVEEIARYSASILALAENLSELDATQALSKLADHPGWSFPHIDESSDMEIEKGRHVLVDQYGAGSFVPNDLDFSESQRVLIVTGPNMGGKSTVLRQAALMVILGQMGAPIPARRGRWGLFDSIYTRIGAHDAIAQGQSTFMVEMSELAHILRNAGPRSLIVLDEIGRGTSTYDGMSVACATLEWIVKTNQSRTLFSTHYHELTKLVSEFKGVANYHMAVESKNDKELRFLYQLRRGAMTESFGIHVAQLAGLPKEVVGRSWNYLSQLERQAVELGEAGDSRQLSFFQRLPSSEESPPSNPVIEKLQDANINEMTPLQALRLLDELQQKASEK